MLRKLLFRQSYPISFKDMKKSFFEFLNFEAGAFYRGEPEFRQRKYKNIEISDKFKELEAKRKQQHLMLAERRKKLLEQRLSTEAKLLTHSQKSELEKLDSEIKSLKQIIDIQNKQLAEIDQGLAETEADYILVEGLTKLIVINTITYLKHMNSLPTGSILTPEATKVIENVHYLVTHNLPVQRYLFTREVGELDQSVQKLIEEKNLNMWEETTSSSIRRWSRKDRKIRNPIQKQLYALKVERDNMQINMSYHHSKLLEAHKEYLNKIQNGQTPFRNIFHCCGCLLSEKLNLKLNEEEEAFKQTVLEICNDLTNFLAYEKELLEKVDQIKFSYVEPPPYIKNHPVLMQLWDKQMEKLNNPIDAKDFPGYLPNHEYKDDGRAFMQAKIRKQIEKLDEEFVRLWHEDKTQLIAKKKQTEIEFYNISTRILEEYQALEDKSKKEDEEFKKLPKKQKRKEERYVRITMDQLTKMIFLNKKDPKKYSLDFFAKYFGMEEPEHKKNLFNMLNSISYLRVNVPDENSPPGQREISQQVLKFVS